jgi:ribonuclease III
MIGSPYRPLEKKLGYRFSRRRHLETALTHRSFRFESTDIESDNQRLEFLGDAALGLMAAAYLFEKFPDFQEGDMTRVRSQLTNTRTLARIAASIDLGQFLRLGRGEQQSGGQHRSSNLSDCLESVIGGAFIDGGLKAVKKIFLKLFAPEVESAVRDIWGENPKGALQEVSQRRWKASPRYRTIKEEGPAHERTFTVEALINGQVVGTGNGLNKREAEMEAARQAMLSLERMK